MGNDWSNQTAVWSIYKHNHRGLDTDSVVNTVTSQSAGGEVMCVAAILCVLLFSSVLHADQPEEEDYEYEDEGPISCPTTESIRGGSVSYSQAGEQDSVLTYRCHQGFYPYPVSHRLCGAEGEWSTMRSANGRPVSRATCKEVVCPGHLQVDNGEMSPRAQWFSPGQNQSFSCLEGFTLSGSAQRNCTLSGLWTGATPVCDNQADDCADPGVPPGAHRSSGASWFQTGEKVRYRCEAGLDLLGSAERQCLESREWSGTAPRCQARYVFDSPHAVAEAMGGSLSGVMDVLSPQFKKEESFERSIRVSNNNRMNIFILLDTSGSISKKDFNKSRDATVQLIRKLDSYEVQMRFHVVSFASQPKVIVSIHNESSSDAEVAEWKLMKFKYDSHGSKKGTNLYAALQNVYDALAFVKQRSKGNQFHESQNIIIVETDGYSNTGLQPQVALARIRNLLGYSNTSLDHTDETLLDVYVFGVGKDVNRPPLNDIASKKNGEEHLFLMEDYPVLGEMFNSMISDESVTMCGVAQEDVSEEAEYKVKVHTNPWHVTIKPAGTTTTCVGSIVSRNWVLTAAHCFAKAATEYDTTKTADVEHGDGTVKGHVIIHPMYNTRALSGRNVSEFYDYDVALVKLNSSIPLSSKARPICLPCTVPANRALKKLNLTCDQHKEELLSHKETAAFFIHKSKSEGKSKRKQTHIHRGSQRPGCVEKAKQTLDRPTDVTLEEYVPDRFLCSGGTQGHQDAITCKGDSGGSLFLQKRKRYFQVGLVSWGTTDVCSGAHSSDSPPPDARDFHISLFSLVSWLKQHLGEDLQFLPTVN